MASGGAATATPPSLAEPSAARTHPGHWCELAQLQSSAVEHLAHDLRGAMAVAAGYTRLLRESDRGGFSLAQRGFLEAVLNSHRRMKDLLSALAYVAQSEILALERTDLLYLLKSCAVQQFPRAFVRIESTAAPLWMNLDRALIRAAIREILSEAATSADGDIVFEIASTERIVMASIRGSVLGGFSGLAGQPVTLAGQTEPGQDLIETEYEVAPRALTESRKNFGLHGGYLRLRSSRSRGFELSITLPSGKAGRGLNTEDSDA
jgi:hypothetical protein